MKKSSSHQKMIWLSVGMLAGITLSYFWPSEPALARYSSDRDSGGKFAIITCPTQNLGGQPDAVFVLDFLTGRLMGAAISPQTNKFAMYYARNIAGDFPLPPDTTPRFVVSALQLNLSMRGSGGTPAQGGLVIAELNSGQVNVYGFPYSISARRPTGPQPLIPIDNFSFRDPTEG